MTAATATEPRIVVRGNYRPSSGKTIVVIIRKRRDRIKHRVLLGTVMIASSGISATVAAVIASR